jgi:hypothetical protein
MPSMHLLASRRGWFPRLMPSGNWQWRTSHGLRSSFLATVLRAGIHLAWFRLLTGCTDGATRIAYDIEAGAGKLQRSGADT